MPESVHTDDTALRSVHLLRTPIDLMVETRDHQDAVLRELRLMAVTRSGHTLPAPLAALIETAGRGDLSPTERPDEEIDQAVAQGRTHQDFRCPVTEDSARAARDLERKLTEIDRYCSSGELITLPRSPQMRAFDEWYVDQIVTQLAGADPVPWPGRT